MPAMGETKAPPIIAPTPPLRLEMGKIEAHDDAEAELEKRVEAEEDDREKNEICLFITCLSRNEKTKDERQWSYGGAEVVLLFRHSFSFSFVFFFLYLLRRFSCDE
jgi:hypothetical protein